jgi:hypothetical protein
MRKRMAYIDTDSDCVDVCSLWAINSWYETDKYFNENGLINRSTLMVNFLELLNREIKTGNWNYINSDFPVAHI